MKTPHKHAELIKAWADGAEIERYSTYPYPEWSVTRSPDWTETIVYRIKPEPKPDVVRYSIAKQYWREVAEYDDNIKVTFDGETGNLKSAEVI